MNIAVIRLKDIIKYIIYFTLIIMIVSIGIKIFSKEELIDKAEEISFKSLNTSSFLYCLKKEIPVMNIYDKNEEKKQENLSRIILNTELALINSIEERDEYNTESEDMEEQVYHDEEQDLTEVPNKAETEIISDNNLNANYTDTISGNVKINNQTKYEINDITGNYKIKNKNKVVIYHSHTCESYTSSEKYNYKMTGTYRTTDLNFTVSRVGDELEKYLKEYGKTVIHDKTYHDYPSYNGSYERSLSTMEKIIENNKDAEIMIDLHRDAVRKLKYLWPNCKDRR